MMWYIWKDWKFNPLYVLKIIDFRDMVIWRKLFETHTNYKHAFFQREKDRLFTFYLMVRGK
jgi:hypothetical protein